MPPLQFGNTALVKAANSGRTEVVEALLEGGADPLAKGKVHPF